MKLRILLTIFLSFFLLSCDVEDISETVLQKQIVLKTFRDEEGRLIVDEKESGCFVRNYKYSIDYTGPVGSATEHGLEECHKLIGNTPLDYEKVVNFLEKVRLAIRDNQDENEEEDKKGAYRE